MLLQGCGTSTNVMGSIVFTEQGYSKCDTPWAREACRILTCSQLLSQNLQLQARSEQQALVVQRELKEPALPNKQPREIRVFGLCGSKVGDGCLSAWWVMPSGSRPDRQSLGGSHEKGCGTGGGQESQLDPAETPGPETSRGFLLPPRGPAAVSPAPWDVGTFLLPAEPLLRRRLLPPGGSSRCAGRGDAYRGGPRAEPERGAEAGARRRGRAEPSRSRGRHGTCSGRSRRAPRPGPQPCRGGERRAAAEGTGRGTCHHGGAGGAGPWGRGPRRGPGRAHPGEVGAKPYARHQ